MRIYSTTEWDDTSKQKQQRKFDKKKSIASKDKHYTNKRSKRIKNDLERCDQCRDFLNKRTLVCDICDDLDNF